MHKSNRLTDWVLNTKRTPMSLCYISWIKTCSPIPPTPLTPATTPTTQTTLTTLTPPIPPTPQTPAIQLRQLSQLSHLRTVGRRSRWLSWHRLDVVINNDYAEIDSKFFQETISRNKVRVGCETYQIETFWKYKKGGLHKAKIACPRSRWLCTDTQILNFVIEYLHENKKVH